MLQRIRTIKSGRDEGFYTCGKKKKKKPANSVGYTSLLPRDGGGPGAVLSLMAGVSSSSSMTIYVREATVRLSAPGETIQ